MSIKGARRAVGLAFLAPCLLGAGPGYTFEMSNINN